MIRGRDVTLLLWLCISFTTSFVPERASHRASYALKSKADEEEHQKRNKEIFAQMEQIWMDNYRKLDTYQKTGVESSPLEAQMLALWAVRQKAMRQRQVLPQRKQELLEKLNVWDWDYDPQAEKELVQNAQNLASWVEDHAEEDLTKKTDGDQDEAWM